MAEPKMDAVFAVFNNHINNADWLAKVRVSAKFGREGLDEIHRASEAGIMSIFEVAPTPVTRFYVEQVMEIVNQGRE